MRSESTAKNRYATKWPEIRQSGSYATRFRAMARDAFLSTASLIEGGVDDRFVRCLYCHYVFDDQREAFNRIITNLTAMGQFVDTSALLAMLTGERPVDGKYFHLSFDDGFRNNFTNALPILRRHSVPAIFFVTTGLIDAEYERTRAFCEEVLHQRKAIELMKWDELKEILDAGYEVGSHTRSHARLSAISATPRRLADELDGSKHDLETRLGFTCRYISWPYGTVNDADPSSLAAIRKAGYEACFGAFRGSVVPNDTDRYCLPRHHFEPQWPISHVQYFARGNGEKARCG